MLNLNYAEFYLTNVCNLSCPGCNRFNSFNFKGHQRWSEYKDTYAKWANILHLRTFGILGGEPLLNPEFMNWLIGTTDLWPKSICRLTTNGFQLNRVKGLYDVLKSSPKIHMSVGIHNKMHKREIMNILEEFLEGPLQIEHDNSNKYQQKLFITDSNNVKVKVEYNWWFHQGAIVPNEQGKLTLHNSNPNKAHDLCHSKECHHFAYGKLYKCGASALFSEFDEQIGLELNPHDKELINNVNALSVEDDLETQQLFIENLKNPIPQCKFCPEVYIGDQIFALKKKDILAQQRT